MENVLNQFIFLLKNNPENIDIFSFLSLGNYSQEEYRNLQEFWLERKNKALFFLDKNWHKKLYSFKNDLDNCVANFEALEILLAKKGSEILRYAKRKIRIKNKPYTNKDALLYLGRLAMQVILKNHEKLANYSPKQISYLSDIFEKNSRGLVGKEKPKFSKTSKNKFNILIAGYDPFSSGLDWENHISNPSGNLALALDNTIIESLINNKKACIKSVIFPVRYREFDENWVSDFFAPYIANENIKMIITFSYGFAGMNAENTYFQLDRFASRLRGQEAYSIDSNVVHAKNTLFHEAIAQYQGEYEFIENALGKGKKYNDYSDWISKKDGFYLSEKYSAKIVGKNINYEDLPEKIIVSDIVHCAKNNKSAKRTKLPFLKNKNFEKDYVFDRKISALKGSGGNYLSNEIHYTVSYLRRHTNKQTGHIHVGFLQKDKDGKLPHNREIMLQTIKKVLQKVIANFE